MGLQTTIESIHLHRRLRNLGNVQHPVLKLRLTHSDMQIPMRLSNCYRRHVQ
jgi:hypothetical protein